ncbi:prepilin peptidase [Halopseudomonas formosensis]|jgi:prepilin peptidase CpaA|uniref:Prepilin peptidase n=1 Tax=Halopseudomonas formosensis TaxID=1002526 RepID=A0ABU5BY56_9GAMM|nr:prepilin peptidase [Halopseudomonas formosensis]MDX9687694.1 prepilin peptidase [Halopseudomonas formosensis]MDY3197369.1 prepilin peptidase [Pseudomonadaceae bacterium]
MLQTCLVSVGLLCWAGLCAIRDARHRTIPNHLTLGLAAIAGIWLLTTGASLTSAPPITVTLAVAAALLVSAPGYVVGQMGAGDVKMLLALGLATDPGHVLISVAGAAVTLLLWTVVGRRLWSWLPEALRRQVPQLAPGHSASLPYAPFLLPGVAAALLILG